MDSRVNILFFTSSLGGGGAEMHLLRVLNHLDRDRFCPSLALARAGGSYESVLVDDVPVYYLNTGRINSSTLRMARSLGPLHQVIQAKQPDILCAVMDHANVVAMLAVRTLPKRPKIVLSVQITPSIAYQRSRDLINRLFMLLILRLYPQADRVVALSRGVAAELKMLVPELRDSISVIHNAGLDDKVMEGGNEPLPKNELLQHKPLIVACGRLTEQKGFSYLIEALARVRQVIPAHLWIIGEGDQRRYLETKVKQCGLGDCVRLLGFQANPFKYMAAADVFVLSSLWEGFGNVLVEAMACGVPVIATDCPYGPAEIITDGINGLLVPPADVAALAHAIIRMLTNEALKQQLSRKGRERAQAFEACKIASEYAELFLGVLNK